MKANKRSLGTMLVMLLVFILATSSVFAAPKPPGAIYLPIVVRNARSGYGTESKFMGIYMQAYWNKTTVPANMTIADNLAGKKHSVTGWFYDIHDPYPSPNFKGQLEALWINGYVSFVNLNSNASANDIASGKLDNYLHTIAGLYAGWVNQGGGRRAFLAPLPEMNGVNANGLPWTTYGGDPVNFKLAYRHILNIFTQADVSRDDVWWVFAPNGWSKAGHEFELYYPSDPDVDVVGFSMYNYGWCSVAHPWEKWENYDTLYAPYISRINVMAPGTPIFIAQTGTTAEYHFAGEFNVEAKNDWLLINYTYLANQPQVLGILYYDFDLSSWECNWKITNGNYFKPGYSGGADLPVFQYMDWQSLKSVIP